jgi:hypothetical protein
MFHGCGRLTGIAVDPLNSSWSSVDGVLFDNNQTVLVEYPEGRVGNYAIPNTVTNIGNYAFQDCTGLSGVTIPGSIVSIGSQAFYSCAGLVSVVIPSSVTAIGDNAFSSCNSLTAVYFNGNAPSVGSYSFSGTTTVYCLPGTTGWGLTISSRPVVLWNPRAQTSDASFGVRTNQFGFNITGSSNLVIVVEACANLATSVWTPVGTNTLNTFIGTNGSSYFRDPHWTNYPGRFYRLRSP